MLAQRLKETNVKHVWLADGSGLDVHSGQIVKDEDEKNQTTRLLKSTVCKLPHDHYPSCSTGIPRCPPCEQIQMNKNACGVNICSCSRIACPTAPTPVCDPVCELVHNSIDECGCQLQRCVARPCPNLEPPNCGPMERIKTESDECGCVIFVCEPGDKMN